MSHRRAKKLRKELRKQISESSKGQYLAELEAQVRALKSMKGETPVETETVSPNVPDFFKE